MIHEFYLSLCFYRRRAKEEKERIKAQLTEGIAKKLAENEVSSIYYILPVLGVNDVINACAAYLDGKQVPRASSIIGWFKTVCL